ncbi:MAG: hypothetical protein QM726_04175 [Chitinophagaceae bacterium]
MTKVKLLFDFSKYEELKEVDQQKFEEENKQLFPEIVKAVTHSFKMLHTVVLKRIAPVDQDKNLCAVVMSGYLCGYFKKYFPQLCSRATSQRFKLWVNNTSVYIKKLDEKTKRPSNIPTDESMKIFNQLTDNADEKAYNIFFGYTTTDSYSMITGIYAVCFKGEDLLWFTDLNSFGTESATPTVPITPLPSAPRVKPSVKKKIEKKE